MRNRFRLNGSAPGSDTGFDGRARRIEASLHDRGLVVARGQTGELEPAGGIAGGIERGFGGAGAEKDSGVWNEGDA